MPRKRPTAEPTEPTQPPPEPAREPDASPVSLPVQQDPPPSAAEPTQPSEPAPEAMPPAPDAPQDLPDVEGLLEQFPPEELAKVAGEMYASLVEVVLDFKWPGQPLTDAQHQKLSSSGGALVAYYAKGKLTTEQLLWANAILSLGFVCVPRAMAARQQAPIAPASFEPPPPPKPTLE